MTNSYVERWDRGCDSRPLLEQADKEIEHLRKALKGLSNMYAKTWDRVDGALILMPDSIPAFEKAHSEARIALGEPLDGDALEPLEPLKLREEWVLEAETPAEPNDQGIVSWRRYKRVQTLEPDTLKSLPPQEQT